MGGGGERKKVDSALFRLPLPPSISRLTSVLLSHGFVSYFMNHKKTHTDQKPPATLVKVNLQSVTKQLRNVREMGYTSWNKQFEPLPTPSQKRLACIVQQHNVPWGRGWGRGSWCLKNVYSTCIRRQSDSTNFARDCWGCCYSFLKGYSN